MSLVFKVHPPEPTNQNTRGVFSNLCARCPGNLDLGIYIYIYIIYIYIYIIGITKS